MCGFDSSWKSRLYKNYIYFKNFFEEDIQGEAESSNKIYCWWCGQLSRLFTESQMENENYVFLKNKMGRVSKDSL